MKLHWQHNGSGWWVFRLPATHWVGFDATGRERARVEALPVGFWARPNSRMSCTESFRTVEQAIAYCEEQTNDA